MKNRPSYSTALCTILFLFVALASSAQTTGENWRLIPGDVTPSSDHHSVTPSIQTARGLFWDEKIGDGRLVDDPNPGPPSRGSVWERAVATPEILMGSDFVGIVQFERYYPILSKSKKSIYTEVALKVSSILKDATGAVNPSGELTMLMPGGTLRLISGAIVSRGITANNPYSIQPNGRYLMFMSYHREGAFFTEDKSWKIVNGRAMPNCVEDEIRAKTGRSIYAGLSEDRLIDVVKVALSQK